MIAAKRLPHLYLGQIKINSESKEKMSRKKIYWLSQLTGWLTFHFNKFVIIATFEELEL